MATHSKKRVIITEKSNDTAATDDIDAPNSEIEEIQVDFEACTAQDGDFHGIKTLLGQLFLKAHVDLSEFTNTIIAHNYVGSVLKQVLSDEDDSEGEDEDTANQVYGITTVLNISHNTDTEFVSQIRSTLNTRCKQAAPAIHNEFMELLHDMDQHVGYIVNERFINIPPQIAPPTFKSLWSEVEQAKAKNMKYDFAYYLLISKTYRPPSMMQPPVNPGKKGKRGKKSQHNSNNMDVIYTNSEEEVFHKESILRFNYSVADERDTAMQGSWDEDEAVQLEPMRSVCIIPAAKMPTIMQALESALTLT